MKQKNGNGTYLPSKIYCRTDLALYGFPMRGRPVKCINILCPFPFFFQNRKIGTGDTVPTYIHMYGISKICDNVKESIGGGTEKRIKYELIWDNNLISLGVLLGFLGLITEVPQRFHLQFNGLLLELLEQ